MTPSKWRERSVAELQDDGVLIVEDGNHGENRPRSDEFGEGVYAFIRAADIDGGRVLFESAQRINDTAVSRIRKGIGRGGDVLFSHKGTVGKLALVPLDAPPFVCSPQTTFWRTLDEKHLDRRYLYYFMRSRAFTDQWMARSNETDMAAYVSLTAQRQLSVTLPEIEEQRAIADVLGSLDDKIEQNQQTARALERLAGAIFLAWFVDFEPVKAKTAGATSFPSMPQPIFDALPTRLVDSEIEQIPEGWEVAAVDSIARYVNGKAFTKHENGQGRMIIRIAELNSGPRGSTKYSDFEADEDNIARPGDVLFAWSGSLDVYRWHRDAAIINQHIFKVIPVQTPPWFVYFQLREAMPYFQGIASYKATTMGHIQRHHLAEARFAIPPRHILEATDSVMAPLYDLHHHSQRENLRLAQIRDTLLPELLSGRTRVEAEEPAQDG